MEVRKQDIFDGDIDSAVSGLEQLLSKLCERELDDIAREGADECSEALLAVRRLLSEEGRLASLLVVGKEGEALDSLLDELSRELESSAKAQVRLVRQFDRLDPAARRKALDEATSSAVLIATVARATLLEPDIRARFELELSAGESEPSDVSLDELMSSALGEGELLTSAFNSVLSEAIEAARNDSSDSSPHGLSRLDERCAKDVERVRVLVAAALGRGELPEPMLLCGEKGERELFAEAIAEELGAGERLPLVRIDGGKGIAAADLTAADGGMLLVEDFELLSEEAQLELTQAAEGAALVALADAPDKISSRVKRELALLLTLTPPESDSLTRRLREYAGELGVRLDAEAASLIASLGDEREALRLLRRARDLAQLRETDEITLPLAERALELFGECGA